VSFVSFGLSSGKLPLIQSRLETRTSAIGQA
jgi:hypothetical protein